MMNTENPYQLSFEQIKQYLPHRYPMLFIDKILKIAPVGDISDLNHHSKVGVKVEALKNISGNEPFFQGHFPKRAVFPGVFQIEALAQTACFSLYPYVRDHLEKFTQGFEIALLGVDSVRFRKPVVPGDDLILRTEVTKVRGKIWVFRCEASVDQQKVVSAKILAVMTNSGGVTSL